jgi:hypothetical protein
MKNSNVINKIKVSYFDMLKVLFSCIGLYQFKSIVLATEPTLKGGKKTLELFGGKVTKIAKYVFAEREYISAIENEAKKLGIDKVWTPAPHNYGIHLKGNILVHKEDIKTTIEDINTNSEDITNLRLYAQFMLHKGSSIETTYFNANGDIIAIEDIKPYLIDKKPSAKQVNFGVDIPTINPLCKNIIEITTQGTTYQR